MMHPTSKVSEQVNRKVAARSTILQLSTRYTDRGHSKSPLTKFTCLESHAHHGYSSYVRFCL